MKVLPTPQEMAAADEETIASGVPAIVLMERAGNAIARAVIEVLGGRYGKRVAVVCGTGNNGGDGFVAARSLLREGCAVRCLVVGDLARVKGAAAAHLELMRKRGIAPQAFDPAALRSDVIVDAIFGTGFHGTADQDAAVAIRSMNTAGVPVVSADIPSGLDGGSGRAQGAATSASVTVTMGAPKLGLVIGDGPRHAGRIRVADIGLAEPRSSTLLVEARDARDALPERKEDDHKRSGAAVAILAGSDAVPGAPMLTARAAGRMGSGYVTLGSTKGVIAAAAVALPEVLKRIVSTNDHLGPDALDDLKDVLDHSTVLAVGPGLGQGRDQKDLVERILAEVHLPVVLDADGLNVVAGHTEWLLRRSEEGRVTVLTPHPGELAKLLETSVTDIQEDRMSAAREAAERFGSIVVLKGHRTLIAGHGPDSILAVNPTGGPALATAGTGDVLTGAIAALFTRDPEPSAVTRACAGVFVHGLAGDIAAESGGSVGTLAWDVAESLPDAIVAIEETT